MTSDFFLSNKQLVVQVYYSFLFKITKAPITPGTQPQQVSNKTINTEPQPLSITAKGGKKIANNTRRQDIMLYFQLDRFTERPFISFTEGPFVTLTERAFASLTEGSMSLSAKRSLNAVVSQPVGRSLSDVVAVWLILIALEYG